MEHQNQNQNSFQEQSDPPPNFDFIVNQSETPVSHKKHNKKIVIIAVLLIILIAVGLLAVLAPKKEQPTQSNNTPNSQNNSQPIAPVEESAALNITEQFISHVQAGAFDTAYTLLSPDPDYSVESFKAGSGVFLRDTLQLDKCQTRDFKNGNDVAVECPAKNTQKTAQIVFTVVQDEDKIYINKYPIVAVE